MKQYMRVANGIALAKWEHRSLDKRAKEWKARFWQYWMCPPA